MLSKIINFFKSSIEPYHRKTQAKFKCEVCKTEFHADYNASINILNAVGTTVKAS